MKSDFAPNIVALTKGFRRGRAQKDLIKEDTFRLQCYCNMDLRSEASIRGWKGCR